MDDAVATQGVGDGVGVKTRLVIEMSMPKQPCATACQGVGVSFYNIREGQVQGDDTVAS